MNVWLRSVEVWRRLLLLMAAFAVVAHPLLLENSSFFAADAGEVSGDVEDLECDESLDLIETPKSGRLLFSSGHRESVTDKLVEIRLILAADHLQRGPPSC